MNDNKEYRGFRDLIVYQLAYKLALEIFEITKSFPKEEKYSLVDQVRRSSRSIVANLAEAWYKRQYPKSFVSKLVDCSGEAGETVVWIDFSSDYGYITKDQHNSLCMRYDEICRMLNSMINQPEKLCH